MRPSQLSAFSSFLRYCIRYYYHRFCFFLGHTVLSQTKTRLYFSYHYSPHLDPTAYKRYEPPLLSDTETGKHTWDIAKVPNVDCLDTCALEFIVYDLDGILQGDFYSHPFVISATGEAPQTADKSAPGNYRIFTCSIFYFFFSCFFLLFAAPTQVLVHGANVIFALCNFCSGGWFQPECSNAQRSSHSDPERRERRAAPGNHWQCQY